MDFSLGEITRLHDDVDLYAMASDADRIAELLT